MSPASSRIGLKPAGTEGYFQPVKFVSKTIDEARSRLELVRPSGALAIELGKDAIVSLRVDPAKAVEADLVFAGYGLAVPEFEQDDFRDLDVRGKVVCLPLRRTGESARAVAAHSQCPQAPPAPQPRGAMGSVGS